VTQEDLQNYSYLVNLNPEEKAEKLKDPEIRNFYNQMMVTLSEALGPSVLDTEYNFKDESPPGLNAFHRMAVKNLANRKVDAVNYLQQLYPKAAFRYSGDKLQMQPEGTEIWYPVDPSFDISNPSTGEVQDITDVGSDIVKGIGSTVGQGIGATLGAMSTPLMPAAGAVPGAAAGAAIAEYPINIAFQALGKALGVNEGIDWSGAAKEAALTGALAPILGGAKILKSGKYLKGVPKEKIEQYLLKEGMDPRVLATSTEDELFKLYNKGLAGGIERLAGGVKKAGKWGLASIAGGKAGREPTREFIDMFLGGKFKNAGDSPELLQRKTRDLAEQLRNKIGETADKAKKIAGKELEGKIEEGNVLVRTDDIINRIGEMADEFEQKYANSSSKELAKPYDKATTELLKLQKKLQTPGNTMTPEEALNAADMILEDIKKFVNPDEKLFKPTDEFTRVEKNFNTKLTKIMDDLKKRSAQASGTKEDAARYSRLMNMREQNTPLVGDKTQAIPAIRGTAGEMFSAGGGKAKADKLAEDFFTTLKEIYPDDPSKVRSEYRDFMDKQKDLFANEYWSGSRGQTASTPTSSVTSLGPTTPLINLAPSQNLMKAGKGVSKLAPLLDLTHKLPGENGANISSMWMLPLFDMIKQGSLDPQNQLILNEEIK